MRCTSGQWILVILWSVAITSAMGQMFYSIQGASRNISTAQNWYSGYWKDVRSAIGPDLSDISCIGLESREELVWWLASLNDSF
jgi:hypothetical protein